MMNVKSKKQYKEKLYMRCIKLFVIFIVSFHVAKMHTSQELSMKNSFEKLVDQYVIDYKHENEAFDFLQKQRLIKRSFRDYLLANLVDDTNLEDIREANFGEVIHRSHDVITHNMKWYFLRFFNESLHNPEYFGEFKNPVYLYVIEHQEFDAMNFLRDEWLREWATLENEYEKMPNLFHVINEDDLDILKVLITAGADLNIQNEEGWTPLHIAALHNNTEIVSMLVTAGAHLNVQNESGLTPLIVAASNNNKEVVQILIFAGADLDLVDNYGRKAEDVRTTREIKAIFKKARENHAEVHAEVYESLGFGCTIS